MKYLVAFILLAANAAAITVESVVPFNTRYEQSTYTATIVVPDRWRLSELKMTTETRQIAMRVVWLNTSGTLAHMYLQLRPEYEFVPIHVSSKVDFTRLIQPRPTPTPIATPGSGPGPVATATPTPTPTPTPSPTPVPVYQIPVLMPSRTVNAYDTPKITPDYIYGKWYAAAIYSNPFDAPKQLMARLKVSANDPGADWIRLNDVSYSTRYFRQNVKDEWTDWQAIPNLKEFKLQWPRGEWCLVYQIEIKEQE